MKSSRRLDFTPDAEDDLRSILEYTRMSWGARQQDVYAEHIAAALQELNQFPDLGRPREEVSPGLRAYPVEQHVVYYRADDQMVTIVRILHRKMNASTRLEQ